MKREQSWRIAYYLIQMTWGLLQNAVGFLVWLFLMTRNRERKRFRFHGAFVTTWSLPASMGLGMFIFFGHEKSKDASLVLVHEFGHTVQSVILGPTFLFVIGIPSFIWANFRPFIKMRNAHNVSYMKAYCESWANALGEKVTHLPAPRQAPM